MTRFVSVAVLMVVLAASGAARAQGTGSGSGSLPNGTTVGFDKLYIHENGSKDAVQPKVEPDSEWKYFNLAHCQCSKAQPGFVEANFEYLVLPMGSTAPINEPLNIWVGPQCNADVTTRNAMCHQVSGQAPTIATIQATNSVHVVVPIYEAMTPEPSRPDCMERPLSATVWGLADSSVGSGLLDYSTSKAITTDSQPPQLPGGFHVSGGESAIQISWSTNPDTDVFAYQALCARADDDGRVRNSGQPPQRYMTATTLCGLTPSLMLTGVDLPAQPDAPDAGAAVTPTGGLAALDPTFLCGEVVSATATSLRIDGLQNGVAYKVVLLVEDKYQNARGVYFTSAVTPVPSTDFWEDLHDDSRGGKTQGGLCLLAETYGDDSALTGALRAFRDDTLGTSRAGRWLSDAYYGSLARLGARVHGSLALRAVTGVLLAPLVALALLWHWLGLPLVLGLLAAAAWWYRRRRSPARADRRGSPRRALGLAAGAAMILLGAGQAHAGGYQPYWEDTAPTDPSTQVAPDDPSLIAWHVGVRVGPYTPDIDKQLGVTPGPYQQMFGGDRALPMLDVDRILWTGFGQVGVGLSLGYMQKFAHTFLISSDSMATDRARSKADTNTFRLIPMALTATYRFTWLDDQYGVPVVPYVRGGLSYYLWWLSVSDGSLAQVCSGGGMEPMCSQNKALGASLGVQGSIGLAIRAERVDASAAMSMQQSGILHAGIYGELSLAKVDGFGSDKKLAVGGRTWFAGVDFEF